ncbi:MAG TPA: 4Fe-4S dicluster domain-containing protein [Candidatus Krumholzibacteria bacterium]|nr:4Fe-4S dicluster domain-containing protein [Candidatus Krumholzibacteria bacterium]HPD73211.1 4Fe-4S dicluster domain-containing protein [Candidatus Krumholzibacteria bacterium]HRY40173.1 4Fe-4S dicluster domain-containing protein [Candidatus Krumholzibacteria bacterium]
MSDSGHHSGVHPQTLADRVEADTGQSAFRCYQCGKCTAGCPLAAEMDLAPHQILRLLQLDLPDTGQEVLASAAIWLCLTCETCVSRCPQEVDLPRIMDRLRDESRERGLAHPKAKDILAFHDAFLGSIARSGRLHEVGLIAAYKLKTMHLLQDVAVAPRLMARGKLAPLPHGIEDRGAVARIFAKCRREKP